MMGALDEMESMRAEIDRLRAERDDHEQARTALEEAVGQLLAEADELREVLKEAVAWDGHDDHGMPAVWFVQAEAVLAKHDTGDDR